MIRTVKLVSSDGEILKDESYKLTESLNEQGYRFPAHKMGARIFSDVTFPIEMTDSDVGKMTRLSKVMVGKTNMLGYRRGRRIEGYTAEEIGELVGLKTKRTARNFVNKMVRLHVMRKVDGVGFYINPAYFMANGQRLSLDLFLLFKEDLKAVIPSWVIIEFIRQAKEKQV